VSMFDGSLSWLAMVAAQFLADDVAPQRGGLPLAGGLICYRPYACKDGWVTLGALEPKFWAEWCRGVGREDLVEKQFEAPGSRAHAEVERIFLERTREEWQAFASAHDCCLEPVLGLDEALDSELVRAREMVVELAQPSARAARHQHWSARGVDGLEAFTGRTVSGGRLNVRCSLWPVTPGPVSR
jgi:alpha-methylacyl-CoA racemase